MEGRMYNVNHSKRLECQPGDQVVGNHNTIICTKGGPIKVDGNHNKIYANYSQIYGSFNKSYGIGNTLYGSHNKADGKDSNCIGSFNKSVSRGFIKPPPSKKSVNTATNSPTNSKYYAGYVAHVGDNAVNYFSGFPSSYSSSAPTVYTMGPGSMTISRGPSVITNNRGTSCITIQSATPPVVSLPPKTLPVITAPSFPTEEDLRYDEEAVEGDEANTCVICLEHKRKCVIRPCKHFSLCVACSKKTLEKCPVCRKEITSIERLFT